MPRSPSRDAGGAGGGRRREEVGGKGGGSELSARAWLAEPPPSSFLVLAQWRSLPSRREVCLCVDEKAPRSWPPPPPDLLLFPVSPHGVRGEEPLPGAGGGGPVAPRRCPERGSAGAGGGGGGKKRLLLWQVSPLTEMASKAAAEGEAEPRCARLGEEAAAGAGGRGGKGLRGRRERGGLAGDLGRRSLPPYPPPDTHTRAHGARPGEKGVVRRWRLSALF